MAPTKIAALMIFCPGKVIGRPEMKPCNLPNAMKEPVIVRAPKIVSKPSATILMTPGPPGTSR